ncbi:MAG: adenosylhomocysteinase, partial [Candidatus Micrarchaeota archaeon]
YSGYQVMDHMDAAKVGQVFVTATGNKNVLRKEHFEAMRDGAILCNSGHFNVEIDEPALRAMSAQVKEVKENVVAYTLKDGRTLYLLSEGRLVNLSRPMGQGHPIEIMDGSFAVQALSCQYIADNRKKMRAGVVRVPQEIDDDVARLILESQGVKLDKPTKEQVGYAASWQEGT